jgi:hypothetical protein
MTTKATIGEINLNLEVISVHQVYISYLTVATNICFCLEPNKFMTIRYQVPCQIMVYLMKRKEKFGSFMSSNSIIKILIKVFKILAIYIVAKQ